jgi:hypothetical protein
MSSRKRSRRNSYSRLSDQTWRGDLDSDLYSHASTSHHDHYNGLAQPRRYHSDGWDYETSGPNFMSFLISRLNSGLYYQIRMSQIHLAPPCRISARTVIMAMTMNTIPVIISPRTKGLMISEIAENHHLPLFSHNIECFIPLHATGTRYQQIIRFPAILPCIHSRSQPHYPESILLNPLIPPLLPIFSSLLLPLSLSAHCHLHLFESCWFWISMGLSLSDPPETIGRVIVVPEGVQRTIQQYNTLQR